MRRFIGALTTKGAVSLSQRRPATKVWVIQCPKGALQRSRWPLAAAAQTGHLGGGSGLVEKDQPMRLKPHARLALGGPFLARGFDIGAILLACRKGFFWRR
jgi:hypothetical protein